MSRKRHVRDRILGVVIFLAVEAWVRLTGQTYR